MTRTIDYRGRRKSSQATRNRVGKFSKKHNAIEGMASVPIGFQVNRTVDHRLGTLIIF